MFDSSRWLPGCCPVSPQSFFVLLLSVSLHLHVPQLCPLMNSLLQMGWSLQAGPDAGVGVVVYTVQQQVQRTLAALFRMC